MGLGIANANPPLVQNGRGHLWVVIFWVSLLLLGNHLIFGTIALHPIVSTGLKLTCVGLLYGLFLLEGLLVAATQIKSSDHEGIDLWIAKSVPPKESAKAIQLAQIFCRDFDDFVSGRQIAVMFVVVAFALILETLRVPADSFVLRYISTDVSALPGKWAAWWSQLARVRDWAQGAYLFASNSPVSNLLLAALIPCWLSQLLPQHLADSRSFEFIEFPLSGNSVRFSMALAGMGAGRPGSYLAHLLFQSRGKFVSNEHFPVGPETLFSTARGQQEFYAASRLVRIHVGTENTAVTDSTTYCFRAGSTTNLVHSIRVRKAALKIVDWNIERPEGLVISEPDAYAIEVTALRAGEPKSPVNNLLRALVLANSVSFATPLPRREHSEERVTTTVRYEMKPVPLDRQDLEDFVIDVSRLTRRVEVFISYDDSLVVLEPKREVARLDAISMLGGAPGAPLPAASAVSQDGGWKIEIEYPETGSEITVGLAVRRRG